jgi:hypothetical protein
MIVHNPPALWQASKNEREAAVRAILYPFQSPATQHDSRIRGQQIDLNVGKTECSHLRAIRIFLAVPRPHSFPSATDGIFRDENS